MPKLRPREIDVPTYPNGAHSLGVSSPRVRYLVCLIVTQFIGQ
jgi:hypothetical protein